MDPINEKRSFTTGKVELCWSENQTPQYSKFDYHDNLGANVLNIEVHDSGEYYGVGGNAFWSHNVASRKRSHFTILFHQRFENIAKSLKNPSTPIFHPPPQKKPP